LLLSLSHIFNKGELFFRNNALSEHLHDFLYEEIKKNNEEANVLIDEASDLIFGMKIERSVNVQTQP